ncbi:killer cell lectin-like receptor subfamily B member 1B allele A [Rhinatrema bivittatum]|uniref:killer cell lectin-like receptor subfamily B member 1B allele A n=1 Tax=Rhinatrema bivittatum TaxID=194408 RepID=UPI00112D438C|nr:killer cell lectin-like receptor subfamily B member 1B allele A [Rhinatrema bivittatum]
MPETMIYSTIRFGKQKKPKSSQSHPTGSSVLQEDAQVTYAALRVTEASEENINPQSPRTERQRKAQRSQSSLWFYAALFLLILCLLLLTLPIILGVLYHLCLNDHQVNQTRSDLEDTMEKLQKRGILRGRYEYCPEGWRPGKGKCYFVSTEIKNWSSSLADCGTRGAQLAFIKQPQDLETINISAPDYYWIALRWKDNKWFWLNGAKSRKPTGVSSSPCEAVATNALQPRDCDDELRWICEKPALELQVEQDYNLTVIMINGVKLVNVTKVKVQT